MKKNIVTDDEQVIFNGPATIIIDDLGKTVVKCKPGEEFDPIKGYLICKLVQSGMSHREVNQKLEEAQTLWEEMLI